MDGLQELSAMNREHGGHVAFGEPGDKLRGRQCNNDETGCAFNPCCHKFGQIGFRFDDAFANAERDSCGNEEQEDYLMKNVLTNSVGTRWIEYFADINPKDISKMRGIERMADRDNLDLSKTMAFGDGGNDISMLKGCKIGVAMGDAKENVREAADYYTTSADNHGIWNALKHFEII